MKSHFCDVKNGFFNTKNYICIERNYELSYFVGDIKANAQ